MDYELSNVLIDSREIEGRVEKLALDISELYKGEDLVIVGILKGAVVFLSDLVRLIDKDVNVLLDFMAVSSYGDSTKTSGIVKIIKDVDASIKDKHVLIVEDIVDTGLTLSYLVKLLKERSPKSVKVCVLLDKVEKRKIDVDVDFKGFEIPDEFVVGYGLDYSGMWRNLPEIYRVEKSNIETLKG